VALAESGEGGVKQLRSSAFDLVLLDVMLPRQGGLETLREMRRSGFRTPVLMLTSRGSVDDRVRGLDAGADDYLVKPFTARELMARVGAHLSMKQLREEFRRREQKEQLRAEAAEAQYQRILESISDGFLFVDTNWVIRHCNTVYSTYVRSTPQELIGKNLWEHFPGVDGTRFGEQYRDAMLNQKEAEIEDYNEPLDAWFRVHLYPTADGLAMFVADVTAQRRQRQALLVSEKLAAAGRLASTVAHEINNPLESVVNLLYLARRATVQEQREQYLDYAEREINRVSHIARQTLGFYRETSNLTRVPVASVVQTLLQVYQGKLKSKNITVDSAVDPSLQITARSGELNQVLSNLMTNAMDACDSGGRIQIKAQAAITASGEPGVEISVTDDGTGIRPEDIARVFEPFFTTKKDVGTGLGLWVVKQIVEGGSGNVRIESSTDPDQHGTTVTLSLPELEEAKAKSASPSSSAA
jgi:signal transduction histidine kinase